MKRILTLALTLVVILTAVSVTVFAAADSTAEYANTKPKIDGVIDDVWATTAKQESTFKGDKDGEGISGYTSLLWDEEYIYYLAVVKDATLLQAGKGASTDSVDLWISETYSDSEGYPKDSDYHLCLTPYGTSHYYIGNKSSTEAVQFESKITGDSYVIEARMKWYDPSVAKTGSVIGYNVSFNNDIDGDAKRDSWISWQPYDGRPYWADTKALNKVELVGEKVIVVETTAAAKAAAKAPAAAAQTFDFTSIAIIAMAAAGISLTAAKKRR